MKKTLFGKNKIGSNHYKFPTTVLHSTVTTVNSPPLIPHCTFTQNHNFGWICHTEDIIAEIIKVDQTTIHKWISTIKQDIGKSLIFPDSL